MLYLLVIVAGKEDRAKVEHEEIRLAEGYTGSSSIEIQHNHPVQLKLIATFYNKEGNLLYEYSPDMETAFPNVEEVDNEEAVKEATQDDPQQEQVSKEDESVEDETWTNVKSGLFTDRAIDVLHYPAAVQRVDVGSQLKILCSFLVPQQFEPVLEWVRVTYHGIGKDSMFFTKNITILSTEKEWLSDEVAKDEQLDVLTTKKVVPIGRLVTSELTISKVNVDHEGIYTCHITEKKPTPYTFISAFTEILPKGGSLYPKNKVYIKFFTCDDLFKPIPDKTVTIKQGVPNCFSCGGYGYPKPKVGLFKDGKQLLEEGSITEMSVGRDVQAITYVINNPTWEHQGVYACVATNGKGDAYWIFDVVVQ